MGVVVRERGEGCWSCLSVCDYLAAAVQSGSSS